MSNQVRIVVTADGKQAVREAEDVSGAFKKVGGAFGDVAKIAGGFVIGAALTKLPGVLGGAMSAASSLNETLSKSNTVFKEQGAAVEAWAAGAAKGFGQSKQQALEAAGSFGNLFVQLGIGKEAAAKMSMQMTELASDFASFHNADITEVITAQSAAFRGEYDALQRFVPTINAAAVEQEALAMTGKKLTKELTVQEKALAVQALMMKGAGDAMGDFDRTSDGAANKQRILDARMQDLSATIGEKLLPAKVALMSFVLDKLIPAFEKFSEWIGPKIAAAIEIFKTDVQPKLQEFFAWLGPKLIEFGEWWSKEVQPRIEAFVAWLIPKLQELGRWVQEEFRKFKVYYETDIKPALDNIEAAVRHVVEFFRQHWPEIERIVKPVLDQIVLMIQTAVTTIKLTLGIIIDLLGGDWAGAWNKTKLLIDGVKDYWIATLGNLLEFIRGLLPILRALGEEMIDKLRYGAQVGATALMQWFQDLPGDILRWIGDIGEILYDLMRSAGRRMVSGIIDGFKSRAGDLASALDPRNIDIPGRSPLVDAYEHTGNDAGEAFGTGVLEAINFDPVKYKLTEVFMEIVSLAAAAGQAAAAAFNAAAGAMVGGLPAGLPAGTQGDYGPGAPGTAAGGGGYQPGMQVAHGPNGPMYWDGAKWVLMSQADLQSHYYRPNTTQFSGGTVSAPSLEPIGYTGGGATENAIWVPGKGWVVQMVVDGKVLTEVVVGHIGSGTQSAMAQGLI